MVDYIIVGAGITGCVIAEIIANIFKKKVLIIEKRDHIGGNCFDYYDDEGILVHKYGPHIFRTDSTEVWEYISEFTEWYDYQHEVLGFINGRTIPIPFNLNSLHELFSEKVSKKLENKLITKFGYDVKIPILDFKSENDNDLKYLADFIYKNVYLNYTLKQWGIGPEELDPSVTGRVPVYISHDNRYFQDEYQGMPKKGYTFLFKNMLSNPNIKIMLKTDFKDVLELDFKEKKISFMNQKFMGKIVYTGMIDEFFNYEFGELPYRSLKFDFESYDNGLFQKVGTVNYPNDHDYTRITEFKHLTGQKSNKTTIVKEYPQEYKRDIKGKDIPYYPIPQENNFLIYEKYNNKANEFANFMLLDGWQNTNIIQ